MTGLGLKFIALTSSEQYDDVAESNICIANAKIFLNIVKILIIY
jgi:hypothetical protein